MGLGPAAYRVMLQERGGKAIAPLPWTQITWGRILDDCADARVTVPVSSPKHKLAKVLDEVEGFAFELGIWRYVTAQRFEEVWVGPVTEPEWSDDGVIIPARDLSLWLDHRVLPFKRSFTKTDLATIFAQLVEDAMSNDTSPGLTISPTLTGILGARSYLAEAKPIAGDACRELARDGVDYTVVGRSMLIGGSEVPTPRLATMTNAVLLKAKANGLGLDTATVAHVLGGSGPDPNIPISAAAGRKTPRVGLVERVFNESAIQDRPSAQFAANTRHDACKVMPLALSGNVDHQRGPQIDKLIPGALSRAELYAGCKYVNRDVRLARVDVNVQASEQGVDETVTLGFIPVGSREEQ